MLACRLFGGLVKDIRRKAPWYWSDFYDALNIQCFSAILYIYLATVTNAITFGGMLGDATDNMQVCVSFTLRLLPTGHAICSLCSCFITFLALVNILSKVEYIRTKPSAGCPKVNGDMFKVHIRVCCQEGCIRKQS